MWYLLVFGQTYPLLNSHCPLLIEAIPLNDLSAIPRILNKINDETKICQL